MRVFILLFGLLAALLGALAALLTLGVQLQATLTGHRDGIDGIVLAALALSALGLFGATQALRRPRLSATVMAAAALGGLLSLAWLFALPALLFSVASALGFLWRNEGSPRLGAG